MLIDGDSVIADVWKIARLWLIGLSVCRTVLNRTECLPHCARWDLAGWELCLFRFFFRAAVCLTRDKTEGCPLLVYFGLGGLCTCTSQLWSLPDNTTSYLTNRREAADKAVEEIKKKYTLTRGELLKWFLGLEVISVGVRWVDHKCKVNSDEFNKEERCLQAR
jgi:hypothetical protein